MLSLLRLPAGFFPERVPLPGTALPAETPVLPDADQARDWAQEELSRRVYEDARPSLLDRALQAVLQWLSDLFDGLGGLGSGPGVLILLLAAAAVVTLAVLIARPRLNASARGKESGVFGSGPVERAAEHRERAKAAAGADQWGEAVTEMFRALVRTAEERVILEARPARTAAEAGALLGSAFPSFTPEIDWLRGRFDEVMYGSGQATAEDYRRAAALDAALGTERPAAADSLALAEAPAVPR